MVRYVSGTKELGITYRRDGARNMEGYTDADFASTIDERKSITGVVTLLAGGPLTWMKQSMVALSTTEAEYMALSECCREVSWLRQLLLEMGLPQSDPTLEHEDNKQAIGLCLNHARNKHLEVKVHYIREKVALRQIVVEHVATAVNIATS